MCKVRAPYVRPFHLLLNGVCVETSAMMKVHPTDVPINLLPCMTNNVFNPAKKRKFSFEDKECEVVEDIALSHASIDSFF